jgi:gamma-glutamyl-gamma-aminobutyrate hydrolase PuuD
MYGIIEAEQVSLHAYHVDKVDQVASGLRKHIEAADDTVENSTIGRVVGAAYA